ncbi:MAG: NfeD family protein [Nitrospira sp.]|jgi:membrane protein implicated in regulation of membrane protease activity|nr:NfeD family protein [Nitrospira sp.]
MTWWYWLFLGLVLAGAEMMSPGGFYLLFFGIAALVVGALAGLGMVQVVWLEWLLFSILAIASLLLFRGPLVRMTKQTPTHVVDTMVGEIAVLLDDLPPGQMGKAELRGTTWGTRNDGLAPLAKGQRALVVKVDGLMLWVRSE